MTKKKDVPEILEEIRKRESLSNEDKKLLSARRETFIRWTFFRRFGCFIFVVIGIILVLLWILENF